MQGNVADYEAMDKMLTYARKKFGKINGILHCAGNPGDGFLFRKEMQAFQKVLEPKVAGTWVLDRLTQEDELEFFAMTSSINSVTGGRLFLCQRISGQFCKVQERSREENLCN